MYEIRRYVEINTLGAANLLDILANNEHNVRKIIVASSMSIYGEGKYKCPNDGAVYPRLRSHGKLRNQEWEMTCPECNGKVFPVSTDEKKPLFPTSIYATTKRDHEEMFLEFGEAYRIPAVALRYFNVYGPRQRPDSMYAAAVPIFARRLLDNKPVTIFGDGGQTRDLINVHDVVRANLIASEHPDAAGKVFNVCKGIETRLLDLLDVMYEIPSQSNIKKCIITEDVVNGKVPPEIVQGKKAELE